MIFDNNSTTLGTLDIPVVEGYDFGTGTARALIESARNDYAMFKAMLRVDMQEAQIQNSTDSYVTEGELTSLSEATVSGLWSKIMEVLKGLWAKVKSIYANFIARITALFAKDSTLVKKYKKTILSKGSAIDNMKVKFAKVKKDPLSYDIGEVSSLSALTSKYNKEKDEMIKDWLGTEDKKEFANNLHEEFFDDTDTDKLSAFGLSSATLISWMEGYTKKLKAIKDKVAKFEKAMNNLVKEADKNATNTAKDVKADDKTSMSAVDTANQTYEAALAYQEAMLWKNKCLLNEVSFEYKQYKAAFMKAVTVNPKKVEESAIYAEAVAEAAAQEVEDVISGAISSEQISKEINAASKNVLDDGVNNDYFAGEYDKCSSYSGDPYDGHVDGTINTNINSRCEAADFAAPLY